MYPDTDTPPLRIPNQWVADIQSDLPERPWNRLLRYEALGLSPALARSLEQASWSFLFDGLGLHEGALARRVAFALERCLPYLRRSGVDPWLPAAMRVRPLIEAVENQRVRVEALEACLCALVSEPDVQSDKILARFMIKKDEPAKLEVLADQIGERLVEIGAKGEDVALRWAMGQVMPHMLGRMSPAVVEGKLKEVLAARSHP